MTDNLFFIDEDEVLAHHGVKGMKWGVRKQRAASGGAGSTRKRKGLSRKQKAAIAGVLGTARRSLLWLRRLAPPLRALLRARGAISEPRLESRRPRPSGSLRPSRPTLRVRLRS